MAASFKTDQLRALSQVSEVNFRLFLVIPFVSLRSFSTVLLDVEELLV